MADCIKNYSLEELKSIFNQIHEPTFRANQVFSDLYIKRINNFNESTTLTKSLRNKLSDEFSLNSINAIRTIVSKDGTIKYLFELLDKERIESVLLNSNNYRTKTLCISSQVGCALNCSFCATGKIGFKRNLTVSEIIDQYLITEMHSQKKISNIVFMGMGEPLLNLDNVIKAVNNISFYPDYCISKRRITISTIGISEKIKELADSGMKLKLAVSLHSALEDKRLRIIPSTKNWNLKSLFESIEYYYKRIKIPITFEYILFEGFNDSMNDIIQIVKLSRRFPSKVNLIEYNNINFLNTFKKSDLNLKAANISKIIWFSKQLQERGVDTFIRKSGGKDIEAACGQLALAYSDVTN